jgi:hypothetical protein
VKSKSDKGKIARNSASRLSKLRPRSTTGNRMVRMNNAVTTVTMTPRPSASCQEGSMQATQMMSGRLREPATANLTVGNCSVLFPMGADAFGSATTAPLFRV